MGVVIEIVRVEHRRAGNTGLTENAHKSGVNVSRQGNVYEIDLKALYDHADSSQNLMLQHGDIVNVLDRSQQKVFVMGEVKTPKSVEIINGHLTLAAALGEVGGVNQNSANSGAIYVVRGTDKDRPEIFHLDARYASGLLLAERFGLADFAKVMGVAMPLTMPFNLIGLPLTTLIFEMTGSYLPAFACLFIGYTIAGIAVWLLRLPSDTSAPVGG